MKIRVIITLLAAVMFAGAGCTPASEPAPTPAAETGASEPTETAAFLLLLAETDEPVSGNVLTKEHVVGRSPCPDLFPPLVVRGPATLTVDDKALMKVVPEAGASWLDLPMEIDLDAPFTPKFNCRIDDRSPHVEEIDMLLRIEGHIGSEKDGFETELKTLRDRFNLPVDIAPLKVELKVR